MRVRNLPTSMTYGEDNGNPLQYSCLGNPMGRGAQSCEESDMIEQLHFHFSLSCTGEGNGNPLQYSCLQNPRDGGAWWAAIYGVAQSRTDLLDLAAATAMTYVQNYLQQHCLQQQGINESNLNAHQKELIQLWKFIQWKIVQLQAKIEKKLYFPIWKAL